jgi:hypothetical protein
MLLMLLVLVPLSARGEQARSAFEGPALEFGLLGGWQSFQQAGYIQESSFPLQAAMVGFEVRYRFASGFGLGLTVSGNARSCYDDVYEVAPCVLEIPVVLELSYGASLGGVVRPWVGVGAGVGFISWDNLAIDEEALGYKGSGLDIVYLRLRAGLDFTFRLDTNLGLAVGPFLSASFGTGPLPGKDNVNVGYAAHQAYAVGLRLLLVAGW